MFLYDFIQVDVPFRSVRDRVLEGRGAWLGPLATAACADSEDLRIRIGFDNGHSPLTKEVRIELGEPYEREEIVTIPLHWEATGRPGLFPTLTGELEIARLAPACTHLGLMGRYDPPLGPLGRMLDSIVLHHLAERSLRAFLRRIADALGADAASRSELERDRATRRERDLGASPTG